MLFTPDRSREGAPPLKVPIQCITHTERETFEANAHVCFDPSGLHIYTTPPHAGSISLRAVFPPFFVVGKK